MLRLHEMVVEGGYWHAMLLFFSRSGKNLTSGLRFA
jgi:hypothetical protein